MWDSSGDLLAYLAEAVVAGHLFALDPETRWKGGNSRAIDVIGNGMTVDAKRAFVENRSIEGSRAECLGFMGAARSPQVRTGVSHYGLVLFVENDAETEVCGGHVSLRAAASAELFLVPADAINSMFKPADRLDGQPNNGLNRYAPLGLVQRYQVTSH